MAARNAAAAALGVLYERCGLDVASREGDASANGVDDDRLSESGLSSLSIGAISCAVSSCARDALEAGLEGILDRISDLSKNRCGRMPSEGGTDGC